MMTSKIWILVSCRFVLTNIQCYVAGDKDTSNLVLNNPINDNNDEIAPLCQNTNFEPLNVYDECKQDMLTENMDQTIHEEMSCYESDADETNVSETKISDSENYAIEREENSDHYPQDYCPTMNDDDFIYHMNSEQSMPSTAPDSQASNSNIRVDDKSEQCLFGESNSQAAGENYVSDYNVEKGQTNAKNSPHMTRTRIAQFNNTDYKDSKLMPESMSESRDYYNKEKESTIPGTRSPDHHVKAEDREETITENYNADTKQDENVDNNTERKLSESKTGSQNILQFEQGSSHSTDNQVHLF